MGYDGPGRDENDGYSWQIIPLCREDLSQSRAYGAIPGGTTDWTSYWSSDQEERQSDAAVHWDTIRPKLLKRVRKTWSTRFLRRRLASTHPWRKQQDKFRVLRGFQKNPWVTIRANQGHCGGITIAPDLMGHISNSVQMERVCVSQGLFLQHSIHPWEQTHCRRKPENKEGRQTIFVTPLNPFGENPDEEAPSVDITIPRKVHYHSNWKRNQDAVYWVELSRAQDQGLRFWRDRSHMRSSYTIPVPADCTLQSHLSEMRSNTIRKTLNPTTLAEGDTEQRLAFAAAAASF